MASGDRHHAEALREEVAAVLAPLGLRLSPEKTRVVHIDEGFDFLGYAEQRIMPWPLLNDCVCAVHRAAGAAQKLA